MTKSAKYKLTYYTSYLNQAKNERLLHSLA